MGIVVDRLRGRKTTQVVDDLRPVEDQVTPPTESDKLESATKEAELHPNEISEKAQIGVQKAEAVALVWSKKAVYTTYAW